MFNQFGIPVIDADVIAHQLVEPGTEALSEITAAFGETILTPAGTLDRARLAEIVFNRPDMKQQLETIIHPRVRERGRRPVDDHGEYCVRGGILDVYPPDEIWPIRIEFIGDLVESIRRFDPGTQRSVETLDQFLVVPVREQTEPAALAVAGPATIFDYLTASAGGWVVVSEPDESLAAVDRAVSVAQASYDEAVSRPQAPPALPPPAELFMPVDELRGRLARAVGMATLHVDDGGPARHVATALCQRCEQRR